MSNDAIYATGVLNRALDPATQPPEVRAFMQAEIALLNDIVRPGTSVLDVGCGAGRHLLLLRDKIRIGIGVDYEHHYVAQARRLSGAGPLHFITADARRLPLTGEYTCVQVIARSSWKHRVVARRILHFAPDGATDQRTTTSGPSFT